MDNVSLKTEMKYAKQDSRLLSAKFKYGNVLLGLAILHDAEGNGGLHANADQEKSDTEAAERESERNGVSVQDVIRRVTDAVAPVLVPIIDQLSGLSEVHLEELSTVGEDA